ncbi:MAG: gliding motility protein GldN [Bacteroidota bacterium]
MRGIFTTLTLLCFAHLQAQSGEFTAKGNIETLKVLPQKRVLPYAPVREADIMWEKRIWRVIDTREKMNLPFRYPAQPLFEILMSAIADGKIQAYSPESDKFDQPLSRESIKKELSRADTFEIVDPHTYEVTYQIVRDEIHPEEIVRYRIKEVWFFDSRTSSMKTRILGIAPVREVYHEDGLLKYETPLFWIYYPHCRELLAQYPVFNEKNDHDFMSWEDLFEMRRFSSYIYKESNIRGERIQDYLSGRDILVESERIKNEIFNFEQDLWSH